MLLQASFLLLGYYYCHSPYTTTDNYFIDGQSLHRHVIFSYPHRPHKTLLNDLTTPPRSSVHSH